MTKKEFQPGEKAWIGLLLMWFLVVGFLGFRMLLTKPQRAEQLQMIAPPACEYRLDNIRVIDGDTIEADILFPLGVSLREEYIRFSNYDAWESSKRRRSVTVTDEEVRKGTKATEMLRQFISDKTLMLELVTGSRDNYGRVLGRGIAYAEDGTRTELIEFMTEHNLLRKSDANKNERASPENNQRF